MIANFWNEVSFGALHVEPAAAGHDFRVLVSLGAIGPDAVHVQLYAAASEGVGTERIPMERGDEVIRGTFSYQAHVDGPRPPEGTPPASCPITRTHRFQLRRTRSAGTPASHLALCSPPVEARRRR